MRGFRAAMTPHWGDHAYVNRRRDHLGLPRGVLRRQRGPAGPAHRAHDPDGFFTQPQDYWTRA